MDRGDLDPTSTVPTAEGALAISSEYYALCLRPSSNAEAARESQVAVDRLLRIPGVIDRGEDRYEFGDADEHGVMRLSFGGALIDIEIPRPWVHDRGPMVFALVFMLAEWLRWEVYDPQIEDVLVKEVVLQGMVAMRQVQREADRRGGDPPPTDEG